MKNVVKNINKKINKKISNNNRCMMIMAALVIAVAIAFIAGKEIVQAGNPVDESLYTKNFVCVTVVEGDTLWGISSRYMDDVHYDSVYEHMNEVYRMNHLTSDKLQVGQVIKVPYYSLKETINEKQVADVMQVLIMNDAYDIQN